VEAQRIDEVRVGRWCSRGCREVQARSHGQFHQRGLRRTSSVQQRECTEPDIALTAVHILFNASVIEDHEFRSVK
jgi:hypothetical protein